MARRPSPALRRAVVRMIQQHQIDGTKRELLAQAGRYLRGRVHTNTIADLIPIYRSELKDRNIRHRYLTRELPGMRKLDDVERRELKDNNRYRRYLRRRIKAVMRAITAQEGTKK